MTWTVDQRWDHHEYYFTSRAPFAKTSVKDGIRDGFLVVATARSDQYDAGVVATGPIANCGETRQPRPFGGLPHSHPSVRRSVFLVFEFVAAIKRTAALEHRSAYQCAEAAPKNRPSGVRAFFGAQFALVCAPLGALGV
jgi:hypothetical protein